MKIGKIRVGQVEIENIEIPAKEIKELKELIKAIEELPRQTRCNPVI